MKFIVARDAFSQAVQTVQRATATRVIQPILSNIKLTLNPDTPEQLQLAATDLDLAIQTTCAATTITPGQITLSARKLAEILAKLPGNSSIEITVDHATQQANIRCGQSVFDMRTLPAEDFPTIPYLTSPSDITVELKAFLRAIQQTAFAAASYETNNVLGGVFFRINLETLEMAATDGSRLARTIDTTPFQSAQGDVSAVIPVKALQELVKLASGLTKDVKPKAAVSTEDTPSDVVAETLPAAATIRLAIQDGQIAFEIPNAYLVSRLLDGQYPQYQQLIPNENKITAYANKFDLIASLERTAVMANERTNVVKLTFDNGVLSLAANTPDLGDSKDTIPVRYDCPEPLNIAFNYKYLLDALKVIESDDVRMETNGALAPTLFKSNDSNHYLCLVMPVQVK